MRKKSTYFFSRAILSAAIVGIISAILIFFFKEVTEKIEHVLFSKAQHHLLLSIIFPVIGLSIIYILRIYLFKKKDNKGIREITDSLKLKNPQIPLYKIPSHLINGFLTNIFGGSTGIEVSSVVASSAIGSVINHKFIILKKYRSELICAGAAAAVTALFNSPLAGIFFAYEVMYKKTTPSPSFIGITFIAALGAWSFGFLVHQEPLFKISVESWHLYAIPYFVLLGIVAGLNSIYLTKIVIYLKHIYSKIHPKYAGVLIGALFIGLSVYFFPALYGEGYQAIKHLLNGNNNYLTHTTYVIPLQLIAILLLKPIVTSLTLASGGDGGVFAPSIFIGAFLGLFIAFILNKYLNIDVIPVNFMMVGMASVLCASIQAPLTSIFLVCGITGNYILIIPLAIGCAMSRITTHFIFPYSVYNYPIHK